MYLAVICFLGLVNGQFTSITDLSKYPFYFSEGGRNWTGECATGTRQSPIDLVNTIDRPVTLVTDSSLAFILTTSSHAFQVYEHYGLLLYQGQASLEGLYNGTEFEGSLFQFHVHAPADHLVDGVRYPLELHVAFPPSNNSTDLQAVIVGFFFQEGQANPVLQAMIDLRSVDLSLLLPPGGVIDDYIAYIGSRGAPLPDCVEPQLYIFPNYILEASPEQVAYWTDRYVTDLSFSNGRGDVRDIQPLNGRTISHIVPEANSVISFLS